MNEKNIFTSQIEEYASFSEKPLYASSERFLSESEKRYIKDLIGNMLAEALVAAGIAGKN